MCLGQHLIERPLHLRINISCLQVPFHPWPHHQIRKQSEKTRSMKWMTHKNIDAPYLPSQVKGALEIAWMRARTIAGACSEILCFSDYLRSIHMAVMRCVLCCWKGVAIHRLPSDLDSILPDHCIAQRRTPPSFKHPLGIYRDSCKECSGPVCTWTE